MKNGLSIINGTHILIEDFIAKDIGFTTPAAVIDIEPNSYKDDTLKNILGQDFKVQNSRQKTL
ncbi:hypothetical protein [Patiriisocius sp. Uisw_017]|jgi:hypothetical protein|uniref:hypothetical protein n=1 Tax=Patiriisocius sp. Uisw_017 TaxID=3230968 RepID=UPI0039EC7894